ncbi:MAG: alkaline phosphatase family protein [Abditibacteriales bacterium]|nr:alkaline phosphatase family protein [Abditibacteriales bacterium]MDW8364784.1 hypothetical protein [Abditibacteriales bacterium]
MKKDTDCTFSRRSFLRIAGVGSTILPSALRGVFAQSPAFKTQRVVIIVFGGGVRTLDAFGFNYDTQRQDRTPNARSLMELGLKEGAMFPATRAAGGSHYGASLAIFTGVPEGMTERSMQRTLNPTVFEYVRKQKNLDANHVWLVASSPGQSLNFGHSVHPDYGARYGANVLSPEGLLNPALAQAAQRHGVQPDDAAADAVHRLRSALNAAPPEGFASDASTTRQMERRLMQMLNDAKPFTGVNAADARTMAVATDILKTVKPLVLGVHLDNADIAHTSYRNYLQVISDNDRAIQQMMNTIKADPQLKDSTTVFILPEFGRDAGSPNKFGGLDHISPSLHLGYVTLVVWGPDVKKGIYNKEISAADVCPTACYLLGVKAEHAKGRVLTEVLAQ